MHTESRRPLRTADLAAASTAEERADDQPAALEQEQGAATEPGRLEALFAPEAAAQYRARWAQVQSGFVDDPRRAVAEGDELVAEVMRSLAESFAHERERLEDELSHTGEASTETLRVGLRRYRSFFDRLLSL
jgi:hypothetical protein